MSIVSPQKPNNARKWRFLFNLTVFTACFYASMEWLFFVTKPSSLSLLSFFDSIKVLFVTAGTVTLASLALLFLLTLPALLIGNWRPRLLNIGYAVPALLLSITALIMLDNFTYTLFKFGVVSTEGLARSIYALGFLLFLWRMFLLVKQAKWARRTFASYLAPGLLIVSMAFLLTQRISNPSPADRLDIRAQVSTTRRPNIIILGSDGLSATYLTVYNPELQTTPFLNELAQTSLVAENVFPNASSTTGSTTSVLTGKQSIKTGVFRYPDILSAEDSFQHLPGLLRQRGYQTVEIGTPSYVDARKLNLIQGFDIVNGHSLNGPASEVLQAVAGNSSSTYFIQTLSERARERLLHIFFIEEMRNPLEEVNDPAARLSDEQRVEQIIHLLDQADQPVFIFAHLMDTHGPNFSFQKQVFSSGVSPDADWDKTRYQDALFSFDNHVKKIYAHLAETGQLDNTILVIYTDHGLRYAIHERIPLIIHFPGNANVGRRKNNVQNIDIPVTLLDYLGIPAPAWMNGTSLLKGEPPAEREIISTTTGSPREIKPPFYQINVLQTIVCQKWYRLNVRRNTFETGTVAGHTSPCDKSLLPAGEKVHQAMLKYLEQHGYDISSIQ